ncbi:coiled-coil domain-containing protein 178 [Takifugu flavidus]|uniref:Coiled-coil domain-containing protein 178 n=1 Tax=Takifugu flavidus TaxID=433684 RepID=A0A5C6P2U7_9TELE|nr:coiled-coil domain-containing protein 178 [Takifugu flavidus]TWW73833.1 hypothetical protein D4764_15G0012290 [Takifugu flavidus]
MPDVEPLRFPSREEPPGQQDQADLQAICSGRRRTCALLNSPLPCVDKAVEHIQDLKMMVKNWCQQRSVKYPQATHDRHQYNRILSFPARDSDSESVLSTDLFIEGIAISLKVSHPLESCPLTPLLRKINDVLGEVMYLIERLEADRQCAEEALHTERQKKRILGSEVDSMALWKQQELTLAVQEEHEACISDVAELKRQLELERNKLDQAQEKLSRTELLNQRLHQEISSAEAQIPHVKESLELQRGITTQIKVAQAQADEAHAAARSDHLQVQAELQKLEEDTNNERTSLEDSLSLLKNQLSEKLGELKDLKMLENHLCVEIKDTESTVALTEEKCAAMTQRIPELMELEAKEKDKILKLNLQIGDQLKRVGTFEAKLVALQEDVNRNRLRVEAEFSCTEEQLKYRRDALERLREENRECVQNMEACKRSLSESGNAVKRMQGEQRQMLQKITDNDAQWEKAEEEVTRVVAQHGAIRARLAERRRLTFMETLSSQRSVVDLLKRLCENLKEECDRQQRCSEITNLELRREFEDSSLATKALEAKIQKIKRLLKDLKEMEQDHQSALVHLEKEKNLRCERLKAAQDLHIATVKRHGSALGMISDLLEKRELHRQASEQMEATAARLPQVIKHLQCESDAVNFHHKSAALLMSTLQSDINNCQQRSRRFVRIHAAHVAARKKQLEVAKEALKKALKENKKLASDYEGLKETLVRAKQEAASALSRKNHVVKSLHYYTQLSLLQKRMHKASAEYFKQRSRRSRAGLDRCQALSHESDRGIGRAQARLAEETRLAAAFLRVSADGSSPTRHPGTTKPTVRGAAGWNE